MAENIGTVYLVGGGPGDPGLLTLRGRDCLRRADVVLYDYLVNPRILSHAKPSAQLDCLGKHGSGSLVSQHEINARMVAHAQQGRTVVRLKGGDPMVFAHAAEETAALDAAGIPYEIVPGITAALAVGSYTGIPLTIGGEASAVALVTGHQRAEPPSPELDYAALAAFPGTLVFYMGVTSAEQWSGLLMQGGKPADTPAAIVRRCSWPDQHTVHCTLGEVAHTIQQQHIRPPALVIVGPAAGLAATREWFVTRPLFGVRVLVTRAAHQAEELCDTLSELGADVLQQEAIEITPPDSWENVDQALRRLKQFDWLVFSSANGVRSLLDRLHQQVDLRALGHLKIAAIGPGTAEALAHYHLRADRVPSEYRAEALAELLADEAAKGARFLLARASRGRDILAQTLTAAGGHVEEVVVYQSRDVQTPRPEILRQLQAGRIDWITVTSSAIARSLAALFGDDLRHSRLASISPITTATLAETGQSVAAEARQYTMEGLVAAIVSMHT